MIVVDTNIIVYACLPGEHETRAVALMAADADWHAPILWRSEFLSVLAGALRRRGLTLPQAERALAIAEERMKGRSHCVSSGEVLRLIATSRCTAYDLEFVALAQALQVPLYTLDRQILRAFPAIARPLPATG